MQACRGLYWIPLIKNVIMMLCFMFKKKVNITFIY